MASPPAPATFKSGAWLSGAFEGDYDAATATALVHIHMPDAHARELRIVRGIVRGARIIDMPQTPSSPTGLTPLRQAHIEPVWVEEGERDPQGHVVVRQTALVDVWLVDWRAEPLVDEGGRARGKIYGTLYARMHERKAGCLPWWLGWLALLMVLLLLWALLFTRACVALQPIADQLGLHADPIDAGSSDAGGGGADVAGAGGAGAGGAGGAGAGGAGAGGAGAGGSSAGGAGGSGDAAAGAAAREASATPLDEALKDPTAFFAKGCGQALVFSSDLLFDVDQATLKPSALPYLKKAATLLKKSTGPALTLTVEGHADPQGSEQHNLDLSTRRAQRVAQWFVKSGAVKPARISAVGYGEARPVVIADPHALEQRRNRRVTVTVACPGAP